MPMTYRELLWAACGKEFAEWERTAQIWAVIAEAHRNPKVKASSFRPTDLFRRPGQPTRPDMSLTAESFRAMKGLFTK